MKWIVLMVMAVMAHFACMTIETTSIKWSIQLVLISLVVVSLPIKLFQRTKKEQTHVVIPGEPVPVPRRDSLRSADHARVVTLEAALKESRDGHDRTRSLLSKTDTELTRMQDTMKYLLQTLNGLTVGQGDAFIKDVKNGTLKNQGVRARIDKYLGIVHARRAKKNNKHQTQPGSRLIDLS